MSSATKQKSSAGKNVLIFFIVFIILEMLIVVGVGRVFKNKNVTPSIAGYSLYIMNGDGMGDRVPDGALVITSNMTPSTDKIGEAVVCENVPDIGTSVFWLYDITSTDDNNGVVYTVYQEKDPAKLYEISSKNVVGVASTYYMTAGKVLTFMSSTFGMIVCAVVPIFLLVVIELIILQMMRKRTMTSKNLQRALLLTISCSAARTRASRSQNIASTLTTR